jgi:hypothetical protein
MLWTMVLVLMFLRVLGVGTGFTLGSFIIPLYIAAVALLVVSLSHEVMINRKLRRILRGRDQKTDTE